MTDIHTPNTTDVPLACDLTVLTPGERQRLGALATELFGRASAIETLDDGFDIAWHDPTPDTLAELAEFVAYDSRCCAFIEHAITVDRGPGAAHLRLRGERADARNAIAPDLAPLMPPHLAAGLS